MKTKTLYLGMALLAMTTAAQAKDYTLTSPGGNVKTTISVTDHVSYTVEYNNVVVVTPSAVSMTLADGRVLGQTPRVTKTTKKAIHETLKPVAYRKASVANDCNSLTLTFKGGYSLEFRNFDNGAAYRFILALGKDEVTVKNETAEFNFAENYPAIYSHTNSKGTVDQQFCNSFENLYTYKNLNDIQEDRLIILPAMVQLPNNIKACITEVNQFSYPGMLLLKDKEDTALNGVFARVPDQMKQGGHNMLQMVVQSRHDYIAKIEGTRTMPWRAIALSAEDKDMTDNDIVYCLADECQLEDTDWIKPGKVAWDWWNDWNIEGVDFRAGINNETYKYYIDFASQYGIEYVILDEGWAVNLKADMMQVIPEIDLPMLVNYAKSKNVGIILWGGYKAMDKDMENLCRHYSEMGVKGFKIDFMDRDDQIIVDFYNRLAKTAAKYKLMIDFHGAFKPSGMNRTWPNIINYEGVHGLEQMKWETRTEQVTYDVTLPFIRLVAGPMDYTQGAMVNMNRKNYRAINSEPMSMGTRCRQLAEYVIFDSPLNMLCDSPSNYMKEPTYTRFVAGVPTVWDETRTLSGEVAKYIVTARRTGNTWYIAGMTNWDARTVDVDLSFLGEGYTLEIYKDGVNADRKGTDYKHIPSTPCTGKIQMFMQPGGGFMIKATK